MSNKLIRLAQRVSTLAIGGETRGIWPSEKSVLICLADDARDAEGGVARLAISEITLRTGINRRTVEVALRHLADAGLIARDGRPGRATARTTLQLECAARPGVDSDQTRIYTGSDPNQIRIRPESDSGPSFTNRPIDHSSRPAVPERGEQFASNAKQAACAAPVSDDADKVFDAWDLMAAATGLPGPVKRDIERRLTIERHLATEKLWRVLKAVRAIPDAPYLAKRAPKHAGQGDVMADFDFVFGVGRLSGNRVFARLLEGSFTGGRAIPLVEPPSVADDHIARPGKMVSATEPEPTRRLRAAMRAIMGDRHYDTWIAPVQFEWRADGRELLAIAPSAFVADWVQGHYVDQLRRASGGVSVRVTVRERVS